MWLCAGIFLLMVQNVSFAVLYRLQMQNEASLREDYLSEVAEDVYKRQGYYVVVEFKAPHTLPKELDRRLKISDNVMRHIIINKDEK